MERELNKLNLYSENVTAHNYDEIGLIEKAITIEESKYITLRDWSSDDLTHKICNIFIRDLKHIFQKLINLNDLVEAKVQGRPIDDFVTEANHISSDIVETLVDISVYCDGVGSAVNNNIFIGDLMTDTKNIVEWAIRAFNVM